MERFFVTIIALALLGTTTATATSGVDAAINIILQRPNAPTPDSSWAVPVNVSLHRDGVLIYERTIGLNEYGLWRGYLPVAAGIYDVRIKHAHTLGNICRGVELKNRTWLRAGVLLEGDANNDNRIRISDFGILRNAINFGRYDPRSDFNEDGRVDMDDYALLSSNYMMSGDIEISCNMQVKRED